LKHPNAAKEKKKYFEEQSVWPIPHKIKNPIVNVNTNAKPTITIDDEEKAKIQGTLNILHFHDIWESYFNEPRHEKDMEILLAK
jgi:hypothetical protein